MANADTTPVRTTFYFLLRLRAVTFDNTATREETGIRVTAK